jgi:hypothetical protein
MSKQTNRVAWGLAAVLATVVVGMRLSPLALVNNWFGEADLADLHGVDLAQGGVSAPVVKCSKSRLKSAHL